MDDRAPELRDRAVPKLTLGQRFLAALPNLERKKEHPPASPEAIEPDAVFAPEDADHPTTAAAESPRPAGQTAGRPSGQTAGRPVGSKAGPARTGGRPDPTAEMSNEELAHAIKRIDDREQRYALWAGPIGAAVGIGLTVAAIHTNPAVGHKGHAAVSTIVFEGAARVVFGAGVIVTAFTRRRSLVAFALLFMGSTILPLGILFWALGLWMIWRVFRYQKVLTARGVGPQRARATQGPRAAAKSGAADARERASARRDTRQRRRGKQPVPTGPPPSKRYTPPKPTRPKPPSPG